MIFRGSVFDLCTQTLAGDPNLVPPAAIGTYQPVGGVAIRVRIIQTPVDPALVVPGFGMGAASSVPRSLTYLLQSEVPSRPVVNSTLAYGGATYRISNAEDPTNAGIRWRLDLERLS